MYGNQNARHKLTKSRTENLKIMFLSCDVAPDYTHKCSNYSCVDYEFFHDNIFLKMRNMRLVEEKLSTGEVF